MNKISDLQLGYLAGIIDGEGWFGLVPKSAKMPSVALRVCMTDKDVIFGLAEATGLGTIREISPRQDHHKTAWQWEVSSRSDVSVILCLIVDQVSKRRSKNCWEMIDQIDKLRELASQRSEVCNSGHLRTGRCVTCKRVANRKSYVKSLGVTHV